jgi:hypothetical protein
VSGEGVYISPRGGGSMVYRRGIAG